MTTNTITRTAQGQARRGRPPKQDNNVKLKTGLSLWNGQLQEEYLTDLKPWSKAFKVYTEMVDDATVGALLESIKTPLTASPFEIVKVLGPEGPEQAKKDAEFIEDNLFHLPDTEWSQHVSESLEFIEMGFSITEKVLEKYPDGLLHLKALIPIGQETLYKWGDLDDTGRVTSFSQLADGQLVTAPMDKLLHFTMRGRKRNPEGKSLLRGLYRPWHIRRNLEILEAIGIERDVGNAPVATLAEGRRYTPTQLINLEAALEGFRMDELLYVILPPGVTLEAYNAGNKAYNIREVIRDYAHVIRQRYFADFLALGSEEVGTQALAKEMTTFFSLALRAIQMRMLPVWNRQLIPWLFKNNKIERVNYPKLDWLKPGEQNLQAIAQAYSTLINAELLTPDITVENRVRSEAGLPTLSEEDYDALQLKREEKVKQLPEKQLAMNLP